MARVEGAMAQVGSHAGLPPGLMDFLRGLEARNSRDWFEDHRAEYEALWLRPGLDLAAALSGPASRLGLMAVPRLNASLRRIHRDTRFSADKRPYEPRLHLILSTGAEFNKVPGVHLVIGPGSFGHGVGQWLFTPDQLEALRRALADPPARAEFLALYARAQAVGEALDPPDLARLPKGWTADPEWEHLLRRKRLVIRTQGDLPAPDWLFTPECVPRLVALVAEIAPIAQWLLPILAR